MTTPMRIAIVEDDSLLRQELSFFLNKTGFVVFEINNGKALNDLLTEEPIDALILDLNLPGEDGISIAKRLRKTLPKIGIVMLTARTALVDRLIGYENGADIYLPKPVAAEELVATLKSLNKRIKSQEQEDTWTLDLGNRCLLGTQLWQNVALTHNEKMLLLGLIQAKNNTLDTEVISDLLSLEDTNEILSKHALESVISRLRKKISSISSVDNHNSIKSVWGKGYQLCLPIIIKA